MPDFTGESLEGFIPSIYIPHVSTVRIHLTDGLVFCSVHALNQGTDRCHNASDGLPVYAPIFLQSRLCASGFSDGFYSRAKALCSSAVLPSGRLDSCKERFGLSPIRTLQFGDKTFIPLSTLFLAGRSHQWDSNPQPTDYKSVALPIALWWQKLLLCSLILQ